METDAVVSSQIYAISIIHKGGFIRFLSTQSLPGLLKTKVADFGGLWRDQVAI